MSKGGYVDLKTLLEIKEVAEQSAAKTLSDTLESMGANADGYSISLHVRDTKTTQWKKKTHFIKMFHREIERLCESNILNTDQLGFITKLSLRLEYQDCFLRNKDGSFMTQKDIVKYTGWGRTKVSNTLKYLQEKEIILYNEQKKDKRKSKYFLNPNLFYWGREINNSIKEHYSTNQ